MQRLLPAHDVELALSVQLALVSYSLADTELLVALQIDASRLDVPLEIAEKYTKEALDESFARISTFIESSVKRLLVVEDDETQRNAIIELVGAEDVTITAVASAEDALRELASTHYDCMVLDLGLHDMSGFDLLERVKSDESMSTIPIIIYTGKALSSAEETRLRKYAETIIVKDVKSPERLFDETALFLHRVEAKLPDQKRRMLEQLHTADAVFAGKKVLVVDDVVCVTVTPPGPTPGSSLSAPSGPGRWSGPGRRPSTLRLKCCRS